MPNELPNLATCKVKKAAVGKECLKCKEICLLSGITN